MSDDYMDAHLRPPPPATSVGTNGLPRHRHYFKEVAALDEVDVYRICDLFEVPDCSGAIQHAIKKLLLAGKRGGGKDFRKDLNEAVDTLIRKLKMMDEDERNGSI